MGFSSKNAFLQVDQLSAEVHDRKKKDKDRVDSEAQTEEHVWTETGKLLERVHELNDRICRFLVKDLKKLKHLSPDYYNYYYGGYCQNPEGVDTQESLSTAAAVDAADGSAAAEVSTANELASADVSCPPDSSVAAATEVFFLFIYFF